MASFSVRIVDAMRLNTKVLGAKPVAPQTWPLGQTKWWLKHEDLDFLRKEIRNRQKRRRPGYRRLPKSRSRVKEVFM